MTKEKIGYTHKRTIEKIENLKKVYELLKKSDKPLCTREIKESINLNQLTISKYIGEFIENGEMELAYIGRYKEKFYRIREIKKQDFWTPNKLLKMKWK